MTPSVKSMYFELKCMNYYLCSYSIHINTYSESTPKLHQSNTYFNTGKVTSSSLVPIVGEHSL